MYVFYTFFPYPILFNFLDIKTTTGIIVYQTATGGLLYASDISHGSLDHPS